MTAYDTIQILTTTSEDWGYAVLHRGIRFHDKKDYVLHMTFSGAECIPAETFFKKRKLLHSKQYNLKHPINIDAIIEEDKNKPFNILTSNCETYVNEFVHHIKKISAITANNFLDDSNHTDHLELKKQTLIWQETIKYIMIRY